MGPPPPPSPTALGIVKHWVSVLIVVIVKWMAEWSLRGVPISVHDPRKDAEAAGGSGEPQGPQGIPSPVL